MNIRKLPLLLAFSFSILSFAAILTPQPTYAATPAEVCQKRVKKINNRGKKLAKKSITLKANYKKSNKGWKDKATANYKFAAKYQGEDRLQGEVGTLKSKIKNFEGGVKDYNRAKKPYIAERNAQVKSYKKFKANCSTTNGRQAAREKIKMVTPDSRTLKAKSTAVSEVYKSKVRPGVLGMKEARTALLSSIKKMSEVEIATAASIEQAVASDISQIELEDEIDEEFDDSELLEGDLDELDAENPAVVSPNAI